MSSEEMESAATQKIIENVQGRDITIGDIQQIVNIGNLSKIPKPTGFPQNIPNSNTDKFIGRVRELENLHQQLQRNNEVFIAAAVEGMGGVGKTELAIQYSLLHLQLRNYPGGICWVYARGEENIGSQIIKFARTDLGLQPPEDLDLREKVRWCWLRWHQGNTLVVVDDVINYNQIKSYLPPQASQFKVLITTRLKLDLKGSLSLKVLQEEDALLLLTQLVGEEKVTQESVKAIELVQRLGYLPLALKLVGRYVKKLNISLTKMLRLLEEKGLGHPSLEVKENDSTWTLDIKRGVAAAFELSWIELKDITKELAYLLSLLPTLYEWESVEKSISALASIPWKLVEQNAEDLEDYRVELEDLHLLQGEETYQMHPLIRDFFRYKLENYPGGDDVKRVIGMVDPDPNRAILPANFRTLPTVNEFVGYPGCYVACYSHTEEGSQYSVGNDIYVMGQVRVRGRYERRICKPEAYENADISARSEFKERCAKNLPNVCQDDSCWAGGDTGGWFGLMY